MTLAQDFGYEDDKVIDTLREKMHDLISHRMDHPGKTPPDEEPTKPFGMEFEFIKDDDYESEDESNYMERETQVEARTGVISRLKQYFHGSEDVNHGALAQYVLKQKSVGSVVTQCLSDCTDDEDVDESGKNFL